MRGRSTLQTGVEIQLTDSIVDGWWHVYFIQEPVKGRIKIGVARDLKSRFQDIQISSPEKLTLLGSAKFSHEFAAHKMERNLHSKFKSRLTYGEWFSPTEELVSISRSAV